MNLKIFIDHRESRSKVIGCLRQKGVETRMVNSQDADYIIDRQCGIERKTIDDFFASIIDKRIFNQVKILKQNFYRPLVILEGGELYLRKTNMRHNVIRGVKLWISVSQKVPIIRTYNEQDTAEFIFLLANKRQNKNQKYFSANFKKRPRTFFEQQIVLLESINGIGRHLAGELLGKFGSVVDIFSASHEDLSQVAGVGAKKAEYIKRVLTGKL